MLFLAVAIALLSAAVAFLGWFSYQLFRQNGRSLARISALERRLAEPVAAKEYMVTGADADAPAPAERPVVSAPLSKHPSMKIGESAPDFTLPDLDGKMRTFSEWRGRSILLIFSSAHCGFCTEMGPDIAAMALDGTDPLPIVVTNGTEAENREWLDQYGVKCPVLLQKQMEIANLYLATGTPMGYLISADGKVASEIAVGSGSLMALAEPPQVADKAAGSAKKSTRTLDDSRIARNGLTAGTRAPDFTLPTLARVDISLESYRGRRVLLVFSDPQCGPCLALDPKLEARHRQCPDVAVLMVSRGSREANQEMVDEQNLTFPVVLQKKWEVSKLYAMFATPIAYLVDENGIIEADIAIGEDEIMALFSRAESLAGKEVVPGRR